MWQVLPNVFYRSSNGRLPKSSDTVPTAVLLKGSGPRVHLSTEPLRTSVPFEEPSKNLKATSSTPCPVATTATDTATALAHPSANHLCSSRQALHRAQPVVPTPVAGDWEKYHKHNVGRPYLTSQSMDSWIHEAPSLQIYSLSGPPRGWYEVGVSRVKIDAGTTVHGNKPHNTLAMKSCTCQLNPDADQELHVNIVHATPLTVTVTVTSIILFYFSVARQSPPSPRSSTKSSDRHFHFGPPPALPTKLSSSTDIAVPALRTLTPPGPFLKRRRRLPQTPQKQIPTAAWARHQRSIFVLPTDRRLSQRSQSSFPCVWVAKYPVRARINYALYQPCHVPPGRSVFFVPVFAVS
ncbi:hypothetical protein SODALDRAFT_376797 [Sodiomyces alkalinus F11]|uniref:Uncharacterized protein n=1 Tax=Sodiomyces alkalinus (strain CBS 110278 / VKM F-3762 / F11) TaxID=1314773 RepID=A0A3N2Q2S6_SODAK|nr:hypothetical protein SODALDRAFT_376797 [Sodiomyces alkalinus F11]ROT41074.1 hypothetical protein SODALDRAFT_376797 [Sodiomyces alkalinus F11]